MDGQRNFEGKVAVITGASSGIGKACAHEFYKAGCKLVLAARSTDKLEAVKKELGGNVLCVPCDVSNEADCKKLIKSTITYFGSIDILINNAGISMRAMFVDLDLAVLKRVMDVNFWGTVFCTKFALPHIVKNKGTVIGISSIAGYKGLPARTGYSSSKFAMQGFLESLRIELLHKGVNVLVVSPGFTSSNIRNTALNAEGTTQSESPLDEKKIMTAEEVAQRIVRATKRGKRDLILTTQGKMTVWLNKFFPSFMDKMVFKHFAKEKDSPLEA